MNAAVAESGGAARSVGLPWWSLAGRENEGGGAPSEKRVNGEERRGGAAAARAGGCSPHGREKNV